MAAAIPALIGKIGAGAATTAAAAPAATATAGGAGAGAGGLLGGGASAASGGAGLLDGAIPGIEGVVPTEAEAAAENEMMANAKFDKAQSAFGPTQERLNSQASMGLEMMGPIRDMANPEVDMEGLQGMIGAGRRKPDAKKLKDWKNKNRHLMGLLGG